MAIGQKEIAPNMSILQYPSSIVRKASATVSSTVSSVASVASGSSSGRRATIGSQVGSDIDILLNAKDKQNLQIKVRYYIHYSNVMVIFPMIDSYCCLAHELI